MCHNPTLYMYKCIYYQHILLEGAEVKLPLKLPSSSLRRCNNDAVVMSFNINLVVKHNQTGMWSAAIYNNLHSGILVVVVHVRVYCIYASASTCRYTGTCTYMYIYVYIYTVTNIFYHLSIPLQRHSAINRTVMPKPFLMKSPFHNDVKMQALHVHVTTCTCCIFVCGCVIQTTL